MTLMDIQHIFIFLAVLLVFGNLAIRMTVRKREQFAFNAIVSLLLVAAIAYMMVNNVSGTVITGLFSINPYSLFFMMLFTVGLLLVSMISITYAKGFGDYSLMAAFVLFGMYMVAMSNNLITLFLGFELASIPSVFIVLLSRKTLEAATKFFIMASISIAILSFAIVVFYGATNSFALGAQSNTGLLALGVVLFIAAFSFEASIFPFNVLIPDVFEGSPAYAVAMLGGVNKKLGFAALLQVLILIFISFKSAFAIVAILSVFTMFYGNIGALMQKNTKRMLAYSSISQAGYIMIGIATATVAGISASLFQIFAHVFLFIGLLAVLAVLEARNRAEIDEIIGLNGENRLLAFALGLFMLSLIGLPFTTGFVGKLLIFIGAINSGLTWLAIVGIVNTVISIYYYARPIVAAYTRSANARELVSPRAITVVICVCIAATILIGVYPQPVISMVNSAGGYLFGTR
jgi:proton-translocating NADH-quinone oxidoreductase chain N